MSESLIVILCLAGYLVVGGMVAGVLIGTGCELDTDPVIPVAMLWPLAVPIAIAAGAGWCAYRITKRIRRRLQAGGSR